MSQTLYDVIIVGGGPAGMSAALVLARSRRKILVFDTGLPRNRFADEMHGYLTRDGISPKEFKKIARGELNFYGVEIVEKEVIDAFKQDNYFVAEDSEGKKYNSRKLLLATGLVDKMPDIPGFEQYYGKSIHHCPYCDGWEKKDKRIVIYGRGKGGTTVAKTLLNWTNKVTLCTNGRKSPSEPYSTDLQTLGVPVITSKIKALEGENGQLHRIIFEKHDPVECDAIFFSTGFAQHSILGRNLGCRYTLKNEIVVNHVQESSVPGVFVSGDAAHEMKLVIIAAGEGAKAAVAINVSLMKEDIEEKCNVPMRK